MCKKDNRNEKYKLLKEMENKCNQCLSMHIECGLYTPCSMCDFYEQIVSQRKQGGIVI